MDLPGLSLAALLLAASMPALAKLPPLNDEAKAKAAEAAAKTAWSNKVDAYLLCKAQDRAAAKYQADAKKAGRELKPMAAGTPCADPGPYVAAPAGGAASAAPAAPPASAPGGKS